jgi:hypothetical protein
MAKTGCFSSIYFKLIFFLFSLPLLFSAKLFAQERLVPIFEEQDIVSIDKNYARRMAFFTEYENFIEAKLFLSSDHRYALEIFYQKNDSLYKDRIEMSESEKEMYINTLKEQFTVNTKQDSATKEKPQITLLNQKGRPASLNFYGFAVPLMLGTENTKVNVGLYMITSGVAFYIPYRLTKDKDVSLGQASFTFYGQSRGIMHGFFLGELLSKRPVSHEFIDGSYVTNVNYRQELDRREQFLFGMGIATSIGEGIAGFNLARKWDYTGGSTSIFQMWGDVGTISGLLATQITGFWDKPEPDAIFGTTLLTSAAGMVVGKYFGDSRNYTLGDAIVYRSNLVLASLIPLTLVHYFEPDETEPYSAAVLAGLAIGSYTGWQQTKDKDFETSSAIFVALGEVAGGLLGAGVGYLIAPENSDGKVILTGASMGAFSGYALMYNQFSSKARHLSTKVDIDFNINPIGLLMDRKKPLQPELLHFYDVASLRVRF